MNERRLRELLVAHALADGEPLGPVLRSASHEAAAAAADAGRLEQALGMAGFPGDLSRLGQRWPAALRPAVARLDRLPSSVALHAPLIQTLLYFAAVALLQASVLLLFHARIVPGLADVAGLDRDLGWLMLVEAVVTVLFLPFLAWAATGASARLPGYGRHLARARQAALAAALLEAKAPEAVRSEVLRGLGTLRGDGATLLELDLILEDATARAGAAHRRFVTSVRTVGYALLVALAFATTLTVYRVIAALPTTIGEAP